MRLDPRSVGIFALQFLLVFPISAWLYTRLLLPYQEAVVVVANALMALLSPVLAIELGPQGGWQTVYVQDDGSRTAFYGMRRAALNLIYLNLALLPALLLATPVRYVERLRLLAWGLLLVFGCHVLAVVGLVQTYRCLALDPGNFACGWLRGSLKVSGQIFAALQWALLTWRYWLPREADGQAERESSGD